QAPAKRRAVLVPQVVEPRVRQIAPRAEHVVVEHQLYFSRKIAVRRVQALEDRALGGSNRHAFILTPWRLAEQVRSLPQRDLHLPGLLACSRNTLFFEQVSGHNAITLRAPSATCAAKPTISPAMSRPVARSSPSNPGLEFSSTIFGPSFDSSRSTPATSSPITFAARTAVSAYSGGSWIAVPNPPRCRLLRNSPRGASRRMAPTTRSPTTSARTVRGMRTPAAASCCSPASLSRLRAMAAALLITGIPIASRWRTTESPIAVTDAPIRGTATVTPRTSLPR